MWFRYSNILPRYTHLVPTSLQFDTPLHHVLWSQYQTKRGSPLSQVDYLWSMATAHWILTKYLHNFYSGGTTIIHVPSFLYSKFHITIRTTPPLFSSPLNKINNRYDTIFSFWGWTTKCPRKPYTNLVQIIKGLVTLYAFSPFQFTIRHATAPCRNQQVSDQTR